MGAAGWQKVVLAASSGRSWADKQREHLLCRGLLLMGTGGRSGAHLTPRGGSEPRWSCCLHTRGVRRCPRPQSGLATFSAAC